MTNPQLNTIQREEKCLVLQIFQFPDTDSLTWSPVSLLLVSSSDGDEKYEKTRVSSGDPTFYKFMKRIAACQEQILR